MDMKIPNLEDKIYELFADILNVSETDDEFKRIVDISLKENDMDMESFKQQLLDAVEDGYSINQQFDIVKKMFNVKK